MPQPKERLLFFHYVRYFVIIWVVLFHVSASLSDAPEFLADTDSHGVFSAFQGFSYLIMMSTMFYVAGFFALPSLVGRDYGRFCGRKLQRLGLPWLVGVVLLGPTMPYMGYYGRSFVGLESDSYWDFLLTYLGSAFDAWVLPIAFTANTGFHHQHFWFLSVLLLFFGLFIVWHQVFSRWRGTAEQAVEPPSESHFARAFIVAALTSGLFMGLDDLLDLPQGVVAVVFTLKAFDLSFHGVTFALGVYAYRKGWYGSGRAPGWRAGLMVLAAAAVCGGLAAGSAALGIAPAFFSTVFGTAASALTNYILLGGLTSLAFHFRNTPDKVNARYAANSYIVYLIQYPIVLLFHLPVYGVEMSPFFKFAVIAIPSLIACYILSEYLIRPYPVVSTAVFAVLIGVLCLTGPPRLGASHLLLDRLQDLRQVVPDGPYTRVIGERDSPGPFWGRAPRAGLAWADSRLYYASRSRLQVWENGSVTTLNADLSLGGLARLTDGRLVGMPAPRRRSWRRLGGAGERQNASEILVIDGQGSVGQPLTRLEEGMPAYPVADGQGGLYFRAQGGEDGLYYLPAADSLRYVWKEPLDGGGALSADGQRLYWSGGVDIHAFAVEDGSLGDPIRHAEVFVPDGRYGKPRTRPADGGLGGIAVDGQGRLFLASEAGVQVFDEAGELLGVVALPSQPLDCVLGPDEKMLYVAGRSQVYAVPVH